MMIYEPTEAEIFHYGGSRRSHIHNLQDPSLCGSITRGIGYRNLAGRMAAMVGEKPYDEELEYLKSNGNQAIDTGISIYSAASYSTYFDLMFNAIGCSIYGAGYGNSRYGTLYASNIVAAYYGNGFYQVINNVINVRINGTINVDVINKKSEYNGAVFDLANFGWTPPLKTVALFCYNNPTLGYEQRASGIIWNWNLTIDGTPAFRYIPVLKDGVPCVYNQVDGSFHYNKISGHQLGYKKKDGTTEEPY